VPADPPRPDAPTLLLLHGTGGTEEDLVPLGSMLAPGVALLSPRGKVLEGRMPRFFRRLAEGVFDVEDLVARTHELADFVQRATAAYGLDPRRISGLGFSNGANIGASLLLLHPGLLRGAALLRPMVPFEPDPLPDLTGTAALLAGGRDDPLIAPEDTGRLVDLLRRAGADVTLSWSPGGHGLLPHDLETTRAWLVEKGLV
jgi:phospholipase/carboxylesterase/glyoxalase family protein